MRPHSYSVWLAVLLLLVGAATHAQTSEELFQQSLRRICGEVRVQPKNAPIPVKLGAWKPLQVASSSILGLVLLGEGNTRTKGPYAADVDRLYRYVALAAMDETGSHQSWQDAFAILFLSEVNRVSPSKDTRDRIGRLVRRLESERHGEKGWYHSLKNENYGPFVAVSIWCTAALSAAKEQGVPIDEAGLERSLSGLRACVGKAGGAFYYSGKKNTYSTPGRSGAVAWVLSRYADPKAEEVTRARKFLLRHIDHAPLGHGSWMMNFGWAALGASSADPATRKAFWEVHRATLMGCRLKNGAFQVQDWEEIGFKDGANAKPKKLGKKNTWPDKMYGNSWATVWMLFVWQLERDKSVLTRKPPALKPDGPVDAVPAGVVPHLDVVKVEAMIREGKGPEVKTRLDAILRQYPRDARLYRLRAVAQLDGLLKPLALPAGKSWNVRGESAALRNLTWALAAPVGKGDVPEEFELDVRMMRSKIYARQFYDSFSTTTQVWVKPYNAYAEDSKYVLRAQPRHREARALMNQVMKRLEPVLKKKK